MRLRQCYSRYFDRHRETLPSRALLLVRATALPLTKMHSIRVSLSGDAVNTAGRDDGQNKGLNGMESSTLCTGFTARDLEDRADHVEILATMMRIEKWATGRFIVLERSPKWIFQAGADSIGWEGQSDCQ